MGKENKGSNTIRRRRTKPTPEELGRARENCPSPPLITSSSEDESSHMFDEDILGPSPIQQILSSGKKLFLGLFALRLVNALLIQTYFVPDEFWQSQEVAHHMVFGYGYKTWEWRRGIRGYLYPSMFAVLFKFLALLGLDNRILLIKSPRILQGFWAALGDLYLYKLSWRLTDKPTAQWTLLCQSLSWVTIYCCTRTLTNSMESVLTVMALYYYPWPGKHRFGSWKFLTMAAISILFRPTAAIIWVLLCAWHLQNHINNLWRLFRVYIIVGCLTLGVSATIDRYGYGKWVNVQYNFLQFNVFAGLGSFYGVHPWHWYITQGVPILLTSHLIPCALGMWKARNKVLLWVSLWTIFIYSFLGHKEFRFLYPLVPIAMHYCGVYYQSLCSKPRVPKKKLKKEKNSTEGEINHAEENPLPVELQMQKKHKANLLKAKVLTIFLAFTNIPMALYFCLIHQRGTIEVMRHLHQQGQQQKMNVMFLMPCHSTPYYSYLHRNDTLQFLTCEPNLAQVQNYTDEAEIFYQNPQEWLTKEYIQGTSPLPTHFVYFDSLLPHIHIFLTKNNYTERVELFHLHLPEGRVGSRVIVSSKRLKLFPKR